MEQAFTGETFEKIRRKMLKGEKLAGCQKCYNEERNGYRSHGRSYTERHSHFQSNTLKGINIAFSRDCNLACRMCGPEYSTKWDAFLRKLQSKESSVDKSSFDKWVHIPHSPPKEITLKEETLKSVELWEIVGGEPFLSRPFYKFLDKIKAYDLSNKVIEINTNGTFFPKQKYLDILLQFNELNITFSVDGIGDLGEYIRTYSKWPQVDKNIDLWCELREKNPSIHLCSNTAVSAYNIHDLYNIFKWSLKKEIFFRCHVLYKPEYLQIRVLPENGEKSNLSTLSTVPKLSKAHFTLEISFTPRAPWKH